MNHSAPYNAAMSAMALEQWHSILAKKGGFQADFHGNKKKNTISKVLMDVDGDSI